MFHIIIKAIIHAAIVKGGECLATMEEHIIFVDYIIKGYS